MTKETLRVDVVSDVMCPWCIVGYKRMMLAAEQLSDKVELDVHWHPFELNPKMGEEGQNLREHIMEKYGRTQEQTEAARQNLKEIGAGLGFEFNYADDMRIFNTFKAHQLLRWAEEKGKQTELKLALFEAFFSRREDVSQESVLAAVADSVGLDRQEAEAVLADGRYADAVRQEEQFWIQNGVQGVPAVVFEQKYLVTGAHPAENYAEIIEKMLDRKKAA
ncbi:MAG: DsbA family oxidoreductase [Sphingomonadales bacterium]|jgi:predicted DsbA family dithiol-disulfide isomerase